MSDIDLYSLDDSNDAHWTAEGEPALAAVQAIVGRKVTREEVRATGRARGRTQARKPAAAVKPVNWIAQTAKAELAVEEQRARLTAIKVKVPRSTVRKASMGALWAAMGFSAK